MSAPTSPSEARRRRGPLVARVCLVAACLALATAAGPAAALTLSKKSTSTPAPGITLERYATTSPKTNVWVAKIDLCKSGIHVDATRAPKGLTSVATWGAARGASLATNGDFYKTGPVRVYGDAVGEGVRWPSIQTGLDPAYKGEWYWHDAGWIAFLHDGVQFSHTGWQKKNGKNLKAGWSPTKFTDNLPAGVLALVGGFPELVIEGKTYTCSSPTASSCFPDRSDMRARHPRTAMGLTADMQTLLLVVVDGRTSASIGMYGAELAELMGKLGAWEAFNLDGGGSSQMWVAGKGTVNDASGNNNGGGLRAVANHWAVLAGTTAGYPARPGHCKTQPVCALLPAQGGTLQETSPCFRTFGPPKFWRTEKVGQGGGLRWTNAGNSGVPDNWAWWRIELAEAGTYKVETAANATFGVFAKTHYEVRAAGKTTTLTIDQTKASKGWIDLGTYTFAAGGAQWVAVYDDHSGKAVVDQHIVADALRLTRQEPWCGSGTCGGGETCSGCPQDCGACAPVCGDGTCATGETCSDCPQDCGPCPPSCGDATCSPGESCGSCPADCGACPDAGGSVPDGGSAQDGGGGTDGAGGADTGAVEDVSVVVDVGVVADAVDGGPADDAVSTPDAGLPTDLGAPASPSDDADADAADGPVDGAADDAADDGAGAPPGDGAGGANDAVGATDANGQPDVVGTTPSAASGGCSSAAAVPHPQAWWFLLGLAASALLRRRRGVVLRD
ncbi:MAG: hypothetical protein RIT45_766 [Pseudomonadota bacterium]